MVAVLASVVGLVAGGTWLAAVSGERESPATCAAEIVFDDRTYAGYGDPLRVPRRGVPLGVATTPTCPDDPTTGGEELDVWSLPGVDPGVAVMADGVVWIEGRQSALPEELADLTEPVACTGTGPHTVTGRLVSMEEPIGDGDFRPRPPYEVTLVADGGTGLPLATYSSVTVVVQVRSTTEGGQDAELIGTALRNRDHLDVTVRCQAGAFRALAITPAA